MTEHAPDRIWSGIQISKVLAGTLAAVSAAVIGSFLGVAGTLAGAAIASIVGSVGTEIYQRSLTRGAHKLQTLAPTFVKAPAAVGTPRVAAASEESPSHTGPQAVIQQTPGPAGARRRIRWSRVGLAAAALFLLAMVPLTVMEMASGRTLANLVGSSAATGTTLGTAVTGDADQPPATTPADAPAEAPEGDETTAPSADEPATPATGPATGPTGTPTTGAPITRAPTTGTPSTGAPSTGAPSTAAPSTAAPQRTTPAGNPPDERQQPAPGTE